MCYIVMCCGMRLQALPTSCIAGISDDLELRAAAIGFCAVQSRMTTRPQDFINSLAEAKPHLKVKPGLLHALCHWWPASIPHSLLLQLPAVGPVTRLRAIALGDEVTFALPARLV